MTEQPGPGHMVMAAARTLARRRMGACETTPPATLREHQRDPDKPTAYEPFLASRGSAAACRRQARSSSPLRGCGRSSLTLAARLRALQLDPGRAAAGPGSCEEGHRRTVSPARTARVVIGPDPYALLTVVALMGAADRVERRGVLGRVLLASAL